MCVSDKGFYALKRMNPQIKVNVMILFFQSLDLNFDAFIEIYRCFQFMLRQP